MPFDGLAASPALLLGIVLMIAGFGFKIAAVPFHMWVPDVYEGAPTPITAYLSVASKAAGFAVILRVFHTAFGLPGALSQDWGMIFAVLAAISMTLGNMSAIPQTNIKRMLGYSSIAQAGYLMVGLAAMGAATATDAIGRSGMLFFLAGYALTNLGAFIAIIAISNKINSDLIEDFSGMGKRAPVLAAGADALPDLPHRHAAGGRLHGQVLHLQRRRPERPALAGHHRRHQQRHLGLLLPAGGQGDVVQ